MTPSLERSHRVGIVASTDHHSGNAAYSLRRCDVTRRTALMAVLAEDLTREGIFLVVYRRKTLVTTGERIAHPCEVGGEPMGGDIRASAARQGEATPGSRALIAVPQVWCAAVGLDLEPHQRDGSISAKTGAVRVGSIGAGSLGNPIWRVSVQF